MKKNVLILVVVVLLAAAAAIILTQKSATPASFAEESLKTLTNSAWDYSAFAAYAHESLEKVVTQEKWTEMSSYYTRLGALKAVNSCKEQIKENMAKVDCEATFEAAPATYNVELIKAENKWEMTAMYIVSDLFKKSAAPAEGASETAPAADGAAEPAEAAPATEPTPAAEQTPAPEAAPATENKPE